MRIDNKTSMRDAAISTLYELADKDYDVVLVSADMGAPAQDRFRKEKSGQFINTGIAEHNMIGIEAGLAHEGKKPYGFLYCSFCNIKSL